MKQQSLSNLEEQVMNIVWEKEACYVADIFEAMKQQKDIAYTTTQTIVQRLYEKGFVTRKEQGKGYLYKPKFSKETYSKQIAQTFIQKFISSFGNMALASFAESIEKLPKEKKAYFLSALEEYEKTK